MSATRCYLSLGIGVLALTLPPTNLRAEETAEQVIEKLKSKVESVETGRADLKMATTMMGRKINMEGDVVFAKPGKMRMKISTDLGMMKMDQIIVSDGATIWTYQPTMKMVSKIDVAKLAAATGKEDAAQQQSGDITQPLKGLQPDSIKLLRTEESDGAKTYVFEGSPQTAGMSKVPFQPAKMQVWVGAEDGVLHKMVMLDEKDNEMLSQTYENIKLGIDVPAGTFEFTPPEGVQVMDMTEGTINMIKTMKSKDE
ncbi:MAG: outer membrane lipoprotein carrier protein LolA [Rhodopirellula sp.]|nr:outer membrane lipoprotein carrier protein LolA [Rhodopirellula sp.]